MKNCIMGATWSKDRDMAFNILNGCQEKYTNENNRLRDNWLKNLKEVNEEY